MNDTIATARRLLKNDTVWNFVMESAIEQLCRDMDASEVLVRAVIEEKGRMQDRFYQYCMAGLAAVVASVAE